MSALNAQASMIVSYPDLAGRVVLVTGASGGIGAATCRAYALSGAHVAVNGRRPDPVRAVVDAIEGAGGSALAIPGDCGDPSVLDELTNLSTTISDRLTFSVSSRVGDGRCSRLQKSATPSGATTSIAI